MNASVDRRFLSGLLLAGAVLAMVGNALHPILGPGSGETELLTVAAETSYWTVLHLVVALGVVLLTAGTALLARGFTGTAGQAPAHLAAVLVLVGGTVFTIQLGGLDGIAMPALAEQLASGADEGAVLATAAALQALDLGLLGFVVTIYLGAAFVAFAVALGRVAAFSAWIRWTSLVSGVAGLVIGPLLYLGVAEAVTFYGFRAIALAVTVVAFGLAFELRRPEPAAPVAPAAPAPA